MTTLFILFLMNKNANADSYFKYGLSVLDRQPKLYWTDVKLFEIGYQEQLFSVIDHQLSLGVWTDSRGNGQKSSGYVSYSPGITVTKDSLFLSAFWGILVHTTPDSELGGNGQFVHDFCGGLKDNRRVSIATCYKHVSSAGIFMPNYGRNFGTVQLQIPL